MENFNIIEVQDAKGVPYLQWENIPLSSTLGIYHIGKRVWLAGDYSSKFKFLYQVHLEGSKGWPNESGFTIKTNEGYTQFVNENSCRLHPLEISEDFNEDILNEHDYVIDTKFKKNGDKIDAFSDTNSIY